MWPRASHRSPRRANEVHSLLIKTPFERENKSFDGVHKGWMNELNEQYDPDTYFLNKTRSVYVNLDGAVLRLQTTTSRVPKRAMWNETLGSMQFNEQRTFDLAECRVDILPSGLVRKTLLEQEVSHLSHPGQAASCQGGQVLVRSAAARGRVNSLAQ